MSVPGGVYKIVLDPGGGPGSHLQLEVGQDCEFSVDSGEVEMEEGREMGESVEILPIHHPASQEITYIQAEWSTALVRDTDVDVMAYNPIEASYYAIMP